MEANEVKEPEWWTAMLDPDSQRDLRVLRDMRSSLKDVDEAVKRIERRKRTGAPRAEAMLNSRGE